MIKIKVFLYSVLLSFVVASWATNDLNQLFQSQYQRNLDQANRIIALKKMETLARCRAYTRYLEGTSKQIIYAKDTSTDAALFVLYSHHYVTGINRQIEKYWDLAVKTMQDDEVALMAEDFLTVFRNELAQIEDTPQTGPDPKIAWRIKNLLDLCMGVAEKA